jgi:Flp pilus assembly protein TadG
MEPSGESVIGTKAMFDWSPIRVASMQLLCDCRGVAAIEFAFIAGFLSIAVVNVSDISIYIYQRMEVENAAQIGTMSAVKTCIPLSTAQQTQPPALPATLNCAGLNAAVTAAIQSTSLGNKIALSGTGISEGYYCVNSSNTLQKVELVSNPPPPDCSKAGMASLQPADYLMVSVAFNYAPLFGGISVAGLFANPINKTAMVRMI